jgi:hypothetical protein
LIPLESGGALCQHPIEIAGACEGSAMENDSIRASGTDTLVDLWINGKLRAICVSQEAIGAFVGFAQASSMSDKGRCEFVRTNLPLVIAAAKTRLRDSPAADAVTIDAGQLPRPDGRVGDRRQGERRKDDRRRSEREPDPSRPDRRRSDRRTGERRRAPKR